jgi:hypothetical protein
LSEDPDSPNFDFLLNIVIILRVGLILVVWIGLFLAIFMGYLPSIILIGLVLLVYAISDLGLFLARKRSKETSDELKSIRENRINLTRSDWRRCNEIPFIRLVNFQPDPVASRLMPEAIARRCHVVPMRLEAGELLVACTDPLDRVLLHLVATTCKRPVRPFQATYSDILQALDSTYARGRPSRAPADPGQGHILMLLGHVTEEKWRITLAAQASTNEISLDAIRRSGLVDDIGLAEAQSLAARLPYLRLKGMQPVTDLAILIPWETARDRKVLPLWWLGGVLIIGMPELKTGDTLEDLSRSLGVLVQPVICPAGEWNQLYCKYYMYGQAGAEDQTPPEVRWLAKEGKISERDLETARMIQKQSQKPLDTIF